MQLSLPLEDRKSIWQIRDRLLGRLGRQRDALRRDPVSQLVNAMRPMEDQHSGAIARARRAPT
jgi:hypothetical protein